MKKLRNVLKNVILAVLVLSLTVPSGLYSFADSSQKNSDETNKTVSDIEIKNTENLITESTTPAMVVLEQTSKIIGEHYEDGIYQGTGNGRNGDISVTVTIINGKISNIDSTQSETQTFWDKAKVLLESIKTIENPAIKDIDSLDAISTATLSSNGIKTAVKDALSKALAGDVVFAGGKGTEADPYIISNQSQLQNFAKSVNNGESYSSQYIKLSGDIDMASVLWKPIGDETNAFGGFFDGNGKIVSNISIGKTDEYAANNIAAFFGKLNDNSSIKNLNLKNIKIYSKANVGSKAYAATIVAITGKNNTIDKCTVDNADIFVKSEDGQFVYTGGIAAYVDQSSVITNSSIVANINAKSGNTIYSGGISGLSGNKTLIMNNHSKGEIDIEILSGGKTTATAVSGGILGMASGVVYNCYSEMDIKAVNSVTSSKINKGAITAWSGGNGCVLNSCYNSGIADVEPVIIFPTGSTFYEGVVDTKTKTNTDIIDILHNNLSSSSIEAAKKLIKDKAPSKDFAFEINLVDKMFYDWTDTSSNIEISDVLWKEKFNPSDIFASGEGTPINPFVIETEDQLRKFAVSLSNENTYDGKFIKLNNDIDVSSKIWIPIGEGEYAFCGNFDGNNHSIKNLFIKSENNTPYVANADMYFGFFGVIGKNGIVKNTLLENVDINVTRKSSAVVGGICGLSDNGIIDSCFVTGSLKSETTDKGNNYAGGIAGWSVKGYIVNSGSNALVHSAVLPTALAMSGGIAGMTNRTTVANCYSLGKTTGYTKRRLEVVESMASVGGLVGVAGSPVVNSYAMGDTASQDYSYYVGAMVGWATGISEIYDVYYNKESEQKIQNEKISPVSKIGWLVSQGVNEEGEVYTGTLTYNNEGLTQSDMKNQLLADKLNSNFKVFPLNVDKLPSNIELKKWVVKDGVVKTSDEVVSRIYSAPDVKKPILTGSYYDGIFYGRADKVKGESYTTVTLEVKGKRIVSIKSDTNVTGMESIIESVLNTNEAPTVIDTDSQEIISLKNAIRKATLKALKGDYSDYKRANADIFESGDGSKTKPYKIKTSDQLVKFAASINEVESFKDQYIELEKDIDLKEINWIPAGGRGLYVFSGEFNGNGYTIYNINIGTDKEAAKYACAGLFSHTDTATIKNLNLKNGYINIKPSAIPGVDKERTYAGLIVGYAGMTDTTGKRGTVIDNCYVSGKIISDSVEANYIGGIAGTLVHSFLGNSISNCDIKASSPGNWVYAGGLVGLPAFSVILNNASEGNINSISVVNKTQIGGIAGMYSSYAFNNFANVKLITEQQTPDMGNVIGRITGVGYIENCFGNISSEQKTGDKNLTGISTVGSVVKGDRYGKGQVKNVRLIDILDPNLAITLNQNANIIGKDNIYNELVREWAVYIPENIKYNLWTLDNGTLTFAKTSNNGSGSNSSGKSSGSSSGVSESIKINKDVYSKIISTVSEGTANAKFKASEIKDKQRLEVESSIGNLVFDEKAVKEILAKSENDLSVKISNLDKAALSEKVKNVVGDRPVYDITIKSGDKVISDFGNGQVSVVIPYKLLEGEDPEKIVVYYMDNKGTLTAMETSYNKDTKTVTFKTNHFSKYVIGYDNSKISNIEFKDVNDKDWYSEAVQYASAKGIMNGVNGNEFSPKSSSTRAMVCTMLWNMEKRPSQTSNSKFKDISNNSWYAQPVIWANEQKITGGLSENKFEPNVNVTREQFAQLLYNYAKYKGYDVNQSKDISSYSDMPSTWAESGIKWAVANEIMGGKGNNKLDPKGNATRAEIAKMIMSFDKKYNVK